MPCVSQGNMYWHPLFGVSREILQGGPPGAPYWGKYLRLLRTNTYLLSFFCFVSISTYFAIGINDCFEIIYLV